MISNEIPNNFEDDGEIGRIIDEEFQKILDEYSYKEEGDDADNIEPEMPYTITGRHIGLKLTITQSFLDLCQNILDQGCSSSNGHDSLDMETVDLRSLTPAQKEKVKASNFPANLLRIGPWQRVAANDGELMAKVYYAKKKIVWEILNGSLKSKIEMKWSDINSIRLNVNQPVTCFEIELKEPPLFYQERDPQPRKHTIWENFIDFTGGSASTYRRHYLEFSPVVLDKHYERLFGSNGQLSNLIVNDFPSHASLYFLDQVALLYAPYSNGHGSLPYTPLPVPHMSMKHGEGSSQLHQFIQTQNYNINNGRDHEENCNVQNNYHSNPESLHIVTHLSADSSQADRIDENALQLLTVPAAQSVQFMNNTFFHQDHELYNVDYSPTPYNLIIRQDQSDNSSRSVELEQGDEWLLKMQ